MSDDLRAIAPGAEGHFQLWFYAAVLRLIARLDTAAAHFTFLDGYATGLRRHGVSPATPGAVQAWEAQIAEWERRNASSGQRWPLLALRDHASLSSTALTLLMCAGLPEEDARFGDVFAALNGAPAARRPTAGLLGAWWDDGTGEVRPALRSLLAAGLLQVPNAEAPRSEWILHPPALLWECLQGAPPAGPAPWASFCPPEHLPEIADLILDARLARELAGVPELLANGALPALIVRGPRHNGRRTIVGALARAAGYGLLLLEGLGTSADPRWRVVGPLATALGALPAIIADPAPGEVLDVPELPPYRGPVAVVAGAHGGVRGPRIERGLALTLALPDPSQRRAHWQAALGPAAGGARIDELSARFRLTGGNIRRVATAAHAIAALDGRGAVTPADARRAAHAIGRQTLDTLASFVPPGDDTHAFAAGPETTRDLDLLEAHCRHRERLAGALGVAFGGQHTCGVRALFSGPSGAGKTLAARRLSAALDRDLYRIDLSAVVNKYIGETEKNLGRLLARAEELDVVLLLDEGDALLTRRTSVHNANDRYANLETNFLLQRLESFEGILIVTTNAVQRVDEAFQRRMDAVIVFAMPEVEERLAIWLAHLPATHGLTPDALEELAHACALSGGQIRNAARYAGLLALESTRMLDGAHLTAALQREYRKAGAVCPLP